MAGEALLARQLLRATGGDGSHMAVEDAVSAQFASGVPAFAKPVFEQRRLPARARYWPTEDWTVRLRRQRELQHRAAGDRVMKRPGTRLQPRRITDRDLHGAAQPPLSPAGRLIQSVPVRSAQDEHINIAHRPDTTSMAGCRYACAVRFENFGD
jgi:hypothetical protein